MLPLNSIAKVIRGVTFSKSEGSTIPKAGRVPVIRAGSIQKELHLDKDQIWIDSSKIKKNQLIQKNDIIMCTSSGSADLIGKCAKSNQDWDGSFGAFCACIRTDESICDSSFLYHFLCSPKFKNWTKLSSGANIKNIRVSELANFKIPLPPLKEQKRIATILDKADNLRRKRAQAIQLADEFLRAVFLDMFGEHKGLKTIPLGELVDIKGGGTPSRKIEAYWNGNIPWATVKDFKSEILSTTQEYITQNGVDNSATNIIKAGNIIIPTRMALGKAAINTFDVAINQDLKALLLKEDSQINIDYLLYFLISKSDFLIGQGKGATVKGITLDTVRELAIPIPNKKMLDKFVSIKKRITTIIEISKSVTNLPLFNSLSQKAFSGQL